MSDHWRPDEDIMRARLGGAEPVRAPGELVTLRPKRERLPEGAAAGLVLVAAACICVAIALYQVLGPRQVVAPGAERHLVEQGPW